MNKFTHHHLIFYLFISVLLIPVIDQKLYFLPMVDATERRDIATRPIYSLDTPLQVNMRLFDEYWSDNFSGRNILLYLRSKLWVKLFRESPDPSVVVGRDGWLFYRSEAQLDGPGINDYQGLASMSESHTADIVNNLLDLTARLKKQNITLIVVVVPNSSTIYSEYLPSYIKRYSSTTRLDQLLSVLPKDINFVDLRQTLKDGKSFMPTYEKTDTHWNYYGGFLASQIIIGRLPEPYRTKVYGIDDYEFTNKILLGEGDLSDIIAARGVFKDFSITYQPKFKDDLTDHNFTYLKEKHPGHIWEQPNTSLSRLLLYGDSYTNAVSPFLAPYFSSTYVVRYSPTNILADELVDAIKPNIVIWEVAERYLDRLAEH